MKERFGKTILILCGALIVLVVALVAFFEIRANNQRKALIAIESIQNELEAYRALSPAERQESVFENLINNIHTLINNHRSLSYIQARAHFLLGTLYAENELWLKAAEAYSTVFNKQRRSYLAPLALYNQAVANEIAGDVPGAIVTLQEFITYYENAEVPYLPRALFNIGRLYETQRDLDMARSYYQRVINEHSDSDYVTLATNRLIVLQLSQS